MVEADGAADEVAEGDQGLPSDVVPSVDGPMSEPEAPSTSAGALFRVHREAAGLRAIVAAQQLGISYAALESYERGRRAPRPAVLVRVFEAYKLDEGTRYALLYALQSTRPAAYRWVEALLAQGAKPALILSTLYAYARLGTASPTTRDAVPVPPRKFPGRRR